MYSLPTCRHARIWMNNICLCARKRHSICTRYNTTFRNSFLCSSDLRHQTIMHRTPSLQVAQSSHRLQRRPFPPCQPNPSWAGSSLLSTLAIPSFSSRYHAYCASSPSWEELLLLGPYVRAPNALRPEERDGGSPGWDCCAQPTWVSSRT